MTIAMVQIRVGRARGISGLRGGVEAWTRGPTQKETRYVFRGKRSASRGGLRGVGRGGDREGPVRRPVVPPDLVQGGGAGHSSRCDVRSWCTVRAVGGIRGRSELAELYGQ